MIPDSYRDVQRYQSVWWPSLSAVFHFLNSIKNINYWIIIPQMWYCLALRYKLFL
jgi:hypothetical protein